MAKCPDCPKITAKDTDTEPEGDLEVEDSGLVSGDVRIFNACSECGNELEETTFSVEMSFEDEVEAHRKEKHEGSNQIPLSIDSDISRTDRFATHDRNGKAIKSSRYRRHYYGISVDVTVKCDECGEDIASEHMDDEVSASGMEWIA